MSKKDSISRTLFVAAALCVVCSVVVSAAAVALRPTQQIKKALDRKQNILKVAGLLSSDGAYLGDDPKYKSAGGELTDAQLEELYAGSVEVKAFDFATGKYVDDVDVATYDQRKASKDPDENVEIPAEKDFGNIKRRARRGLVYLVKKDGKLDQAVLPVRGKGLWGTMFGFVSLRSDFSTVAGFALPENIETPGLGAEVENPSWKAQWNGKQIFGDDGSIQISVIKGKVRAGNPEEKFQVDGLAGATITSRGVTDLLRYWMGEHGYGPFLKQLATES